MKSLAVALLALFTFLAAPQIPTLRTARAETTNPAPDIVKILMSMEEEREPDPVVACQSKDGTDKCVPHYRFSDEVSDASARKAIKWIEAANKAGAAELLIELNTPGGSVPDGFELARAIEDSAAPVTCVVDGDAASMGFYLLQSCDYRLMTKRSKLMAHEPALGGMFRGQPNQWQAIANMLKAEADALAEHCAHRLKVSLKYYHSKTDGSQMWFMTHGEALKIAAVDEVAVSVRSYRDKMLHRAEKAPKQP